MLPPLLLLESYEPTMYEMERRIDHRQTLVMDALFDIARRAGVIDPESVRPRNPPELERGADLACCR